MATDSQNNGAGYEDSRFENVPGQNFHCPLCMNVLKEPKMCKSNQHIFCKECIAVRLQSEAKCPECGEELSRKSLKPPPQVLLNCLAKFNIKCDYYSRGCQDFVQLGDLCEHVEGCSFAPVVCSNEGCGIVLNRRDKSHHETDICEHRQMKASCQGCGELRKEIAQLKQQLASQSITTKTSFEEVLRNQSTIQEQLGTLSKTLTTVHHVMLSPLHGEHSIDDIVIAGGDTDEGVSSSVEFYSWESYEWEELPDMNEAHGGASWFTYQTKFFIAGGWCTDNPTDTIEMIDVNQESLEWEIFPAKLPAQLDGHKTVVYQNRLITTGGISDDCNPNNIYETLLTPPYTTKYLCPLPRAHHGTEVVGDKVYIFGGQNNEAVLDSVCVYDIAKNECKAMSALPYPVSKMSTVVFESTKVLVIGGKGKDRKALGKVIMYDITTGESELLPSMKCRRKGSTAVATGNGMVVMGGENENGDMLNSVEYFNMNTYTWQDLPPMIKPRSYACAVIRPQEPEDS